MTKWFVVEGDECINGDFPVEPVGVSKIVAGYQFMIAIGRWK